jgi:hypothetical protein
VTLDARRWLPFLLAGVALHSITLGILMLWNPLAVLQWVGWSYEGSRFFPAQSGLFLLILGVVYVGALWHRPLALVLVLSKVFAVVFLVAETMAGNCPRMVYLPALADGAMGLAVAVLLINERRSSGLR